MTRKQAIAVVLHTLPTTEADHPFLAVGRAVLLPPPPAVAAAAAVGSCVGVETLLFDESIIRFIPDECRPASMQAIIDL